MNKDELIEKVKQLTDLTNDEKAELIAGLRKKKYGLVWENHVEDVEEHLREYLPVLKEDTTKALTEGGEDAPNHILIEGDNLEALTALTYTHEGKVDVIYIDPPYNTGNKDFVYNDSYVDSEDGYRHSKWLSFMEKRLRIAKKLLKDTGVLFISIDYYSFAQLKLLCDEIFENSNNPDNWNFLECLIWNKQHSQQQGKFKRYHEYIYVYAKNASNISNVLSKGEGIIEAGAMKKISAKNPSSEFHFPAGVTFEAKDGTRFTGCYGDSEKVYVKDGILEADGGKTKYPVTLEAGWTQKKQMTSYFEGLDTYDTKGQKIIEFYFNSTGKIKCRKDREVVTPSSLLPEFGMGSEHTAHLEEIFGLPNMFTNPKPVEMIKLFCEWFCPSQGGVILDFFAGSGTTLESTMSLNNNDNGNRQCILVQAPEPTYEIDSNGQEKPKEGCKVAYENGYRYITQITYERNKRVINGYTTPKGEKVEGLHDNNLRYYKVDFVPRDNSLEGMRKLMAGSTDLLCIKHYLYHEEHTFGSLKLRPHIARYFAEGSKQMLIIYKVDAIEYFVKEIAQMPEGTQIMVYVFSTNNYAMDADFEGVADKVTLCALPAAIYNAYLKVLPKKKIPVGADVDQEEPTLFNGEEDEQ